jgi:hypothetical protein
LQVVVGEIRPFLGELAFDDVPVAFELQCVHELVFRLWWCIGWAAVELAVPPCYLPN